MPLGQQIAPYLPLLRRYARALSGDQIAGDRLVRSTLETIIAAPEAFPTDVDPRLGLYTVFHRLWQQRTETSASNAEEGKASIAFDRLSPITPRPRQALLLTAMEGFSSKEAAYLIGVSESQINQWLEEAIAEIDRQIHCRVLIVEDEPIIAFDIETIVHDLGHDIVGVATTRDEAVSLAKTNPPGLILSDIQLADDSSGIDAVQDILKEINVPVIFITAFPERLLTGERPEPTFLITKPFQVDTIKATIAQALFCNPLSLAA
ncbi:MAG: response regulator [Zymomonas mobilis subsp. pomaceae]|uniref:RNA polymerase, sigma-24 subunit, ECF subfamily n=1 Tax=Zymomonas mobilis subsp. pomaceae (strain ATCC 29192 / DSM 22645 / JCM 10191 / CCUG 17912 / NBRC 13757 / NCIMB 11200 / NRRL B-4491 / Barker I) TaxID=579138 RepID=F8EWD9_ZYMMT|nr:response regulator [Zymomonas mobilis]AEI38549.1 RNA polymerase, sigma-24 subunit, ECF subfamily [Zymomonas mobilis subsp. pomaceae ATCC 29192]MDX5948239.1 response regulator [Zymomonas mobilis subsp. pomaceae]GEB88994.1 response regulator [Zymomonas mobilis subsp. pomaceae]